MHEVGISGTFRAWHEMPGAEGPEGERHQHDYRIDLLVTRPELDEHGMVWNIEDLEAALADILSRLEGNDLEPVVASGESGVTVEVLARWVHSELCRAMRGTSDVVLRIRAWESPTAFGGYSAPMSSS
jgi:6-pyruvoyltetrahydropterin/6-carboxytetrahydropterin synthase